MRKMLSSWQWRVFYVALTIGALIVAAAAPTGWD